MSEIHCLFDEHVLCQSPGRRADPFIVKSNGFSSACDKLMDTLYKSPRFDLRLKRYVHSFEVDHEQVSSDQVWNCIIDLNSHLPVALTASFLCSLLSELAANGRHVHGTSLVSVECEEIRCEGTCWVSTAESLSILSFDF